MLLPPCHQTLLSFQIKLHGQRCKHCIYHLPRLGKHIDFRHKSDDLLALLHGDLQRTQAHTQIAPYFGQFDEESLPAQEIPQQVGGEPTISMTALLELRKDADPEMKAKLRLALLT